MLSRAMTFALEYHRDVKRLAKYSGLRWMAVPLALFGMLLLPAVLVSVSLAQNGGVSAGSSTHSGSASRPSASVTHTANSPHSTGTTRITNGNHQPRHTVNGIGYYPYGYAVPYAGDANDANSSANANNDADYQGGPTIFDRRGTGPNAYVHTPYSGPAHAQNAPAGGASAVDESVQTPTTLVFKDGHQLEVGNYAIVSQTLYDLTPGHPRKIALTDLDLPATQKQNNGGAFQLPPVEQTH